jgi:serine/threonine-protein kinase
VAERDLLRRISACLAGDRPVDWDDMERQAANDEEREEVRHLRVVAAMAGFHRSAQAGDQSMDFSLSTEVSIARAITELGGASQSPPAAEPDFPPGTRWGHIEIVERVGRGAFGVVYRGRDLRLDRIVALKLLDREAPKQSDEVVREARLLARVRHPNVVTVYGADRVEERVGIWMEFLHGETLDRIVRTRGAFDAREAALVGIDLCRALAAVHAAGIVHQDVKLGNVMRAEGGRIVLMDFGLGREARPRQGSRGKSRQILGTPLFMAPEVLRGDRADTRSDVYSLGVVLFALVTGALPADATSFSELVDKHARGELRRARDLRPDLPEPFGHVLDRALAPDPRLRLATAGEMEQALLHSLGSTIASHSAPARSHSGGRHRVGVARLGWMVAAAVTVVAFGLWMLGSRRTPESAPQAPFRDIPDLVLDGRDGGTLFGLAAAGVGDVDQDGFDDMLVGAPGTANLTGAIHLYKGSRTGLDVAPSRSWTGKHAGGALGYSIAAFTQLAPVDGFADLIVGAPGDGVVDETFRPGFQAVGAVYVYPGTREGPNVEPVQVLACDRPFTLFGHSIATADIDNDGGDDLLVGEPCFPAPDSASGRAAVYLSRNQSFSTRPAWVATGPPGSHFGACVALGDVNNDGYRDAVIGAWLADFGDLVDAGAAYVYLGSRAGLDSIPTVIRGRHANARFGRDVVFVGDVQGDGFGDLLVGAEGGTRPERSEGIVEIYYGSAKGISVYPALFLESNAIGANFGGHAGPLGDLDGDGCNDFFVGAIRYRQTEPAEGAAYLFHGSRQGDIRRSWFRVGGKAHSWLGEAGGLAGDVNGDGSPELWISAPSRDGRAGSDIGRVEIFLGGRRR